MGAAGLFGQECGAAGRGHASRQIAKRRRGYGDDCPHVGRRHGRDKNKLPNQRPDHQAAWMKSVTLMQTKPCDHNADWTGEKTQGIPRAAVDSPSHRLDHSVARTPVTNINWPGAGQPGPPSALRCAPSPVLMAAGRCSASARADRAASGWLPPPPCMTGREAWQGRAPPHVERHAAAAARDEKQESG